MVALVAALSLIVGAGIGPDAPVGSYVFARESVECRGVGDRTAPVAVVVTDVHRVRRARVRATVTQLRFRDAGVTRPGDTFEAIEVADGGRTFSPAAQMAVVFESPGCTSQNLVLGVGVRACIMMVLECAEPDAGVP